MRSDATKRRYSGEDVAYMSRTLPLESNFRLGMFELIRTAGAIVISLRLGNCQWQGEGSQHDRIARQSCE
jgi:hypothetical protein